VTPATPFPRTLASASAGDEHALAELYRSLAPAVIGYLRGQGAAEPEDVASEVFVSLVRGLPGFEGDEEGFRAWVFTIAHRRLIDERRRLARRLEDPVDPGDLPVTPLDVVNAEDEALARLEGAWMLTRVQDLTPAQRDVILLRVVADLSVDRVAAILGKEPGAVKMLQRRGLARLARTIVPDPVT